MLLINVIPLAVLVLIGVAEAQHVAITGIQTGIKNGARPYRRDIRDLRTDNTAW